MNRKEYQAQRQQLLATMKAAIAANDATKAHEIGKQIQDLDAKFSELAKAQANFNALQAAAPAPKDLAPVEQIAADESAEVQPTAASPLYATAFAKSLAGVKLSTKEQAIFARINTETNFAGLSVEKNGVLVPKTTINEIWTEMEEQHPIIDQLAETFISGSVSIPKATDTGDDAEWVDETTESADGDVNTDDIELKGCELEKSVLVTYKMQKMGIDAYSNFINGLLSEKNGNALAKGIVSGKGQPGTGDTFKAQPIGILTALKAEKDTPQMATYTDQMSYRDITNLNAKVKSKYFKDACYFATNNTIWAQLANITDSKGSPIFIPDPTGQVVGHMFGRPVLEEDAVEDNALLLANVKKGYACNANADMALMTEDHPKARKTDYICYSIIDGAPRTTKAFGYLSKK